MSRCRESVYGEHDSNGRRDGRCTWCSAYVAAPASRPDLGRARAVIGGRVIGGRVRTELDDAYRYHYDSDWGSDPLDR